MPYAWEIITDEQWRQLSNRQIARLLGCTAAAVTYQRRQRGHERSTHTTTRHDWSQVAGLWATHTNRQIADLLGAPVGTVRHRRSKGGHPPSPRHPRHVDPTKRHSERVLLLLKPADAERLQERADRAGVSPSEIARTLLLESLADPPQPTTTDKPPPHGEIRLDDEGGLDEVVASEVPHVHLERMDQGAWWLRLDLADGGAIVVNLEARRPATTLIEGRAEREHG